MKGHIKSENFNRLFKWLLFRLPACLCGFTLRQAQCTALWLGCSLILTGCSSETTTVDDLLLLKGAWTSEDGQLTEYWKRNGDSGLIGYGFFLENGVDTNIFETLQINSTKDGIVYTATVPEQNQGKPVHFLLDPENSGEGFLFINEKHDFPRTIHYTLAGNDTLNVALSGMEGAEKKEMKFSLYRKKQER